MPHQIAPLRIACIVVALLAALAGLAAPVTADTFPLTITDDAGVHYLLDGACAHRQPQSRAHRDRVCARRR